MATFTMFVSVLLLVSGTLAGLSRRQLLLNRCNHLCTEDQLYAPVCGSDGQTYSNMCKFSVASCIWQEMHRSLSVVAHTACHAIDSQFGHVNPSSCDQICDEDARPLCASDGQVYNNPCMYQRAECEAAKNQTRLSIVVYGDSCPTPQTPNCEQYHVDTSDLAVEGGTALDPVCSSSFHYVCASDSKTYANECQLCRHMETSGESLTITYNSTCHNSGSSVGSPFDPWDPLMSLLYPDSLDPLVG